MGYMNTLEVITVAQYCEQNSIGLSIARYRLKNAGFAFDRTAQVTPEIAQALNVGRNTRAPRPTPKPTPPQPAPERITTPDTTPETKDTPVFGWQFLLDVPTAAEFGSLACLAQSWPLPLARSTFTPRSNCAQGKVILPKTSACSFARYWAVSFAGSTGKRFLRFTRATPLCAITFARGLRSCLVAYHSRHWCKLVS
jgi:hypothetical protein